MQVFFEDLALPHLIRTQSAETPEWKPHPRRLHQRRHANNLHVVRSMRGALGRRIALAPTAGANCTQLEAPGAAAGQPADAERDDAIAQTREPHRAAALAHRGDSLLDPIDLRFRSRVRVPVPTSKAVMFCLMDVSGSMDESRKELSKRFFILLYLFLTRHYEKIDIVFIRHHPRRRRWTSKGFFHSTETGGTVVSARWC